MHKNNRIQRYEHSFLGKIVPRYALFSLPACLLLDCAVYFITKVLQVVFRLPFFDLSLPIDGAIPFRPGWIYVYVLCFVFWGCCFTLVSRQGKREWYRFFTANTAALLVCLVSFLVLPTRIERPSAEGPGVTLWVTRVVMAVDSPAVNLFPSIHCLGAWIGWCGLRGRKEYPFPMRAFVFGYAVLVCVSTLFVKQHYFIDTVAGVLLAEAVTLLVRLKPALARPCERLFDALDRSVFGAGETAEVPGEDDARTEEKRDET